MKRLALLALVSSAFGCAATVRSDPSYPGYQPAYQPASRAARVQTRWVTLADRFSAQSDRQFIKVDGQDAFRSLRIEAVQGAPVIKQVGIEYSHGGTQKVVVDQRLAPGEARTISLNGRQPIHRIVVYTAPEYGGAYSVYGG